VNLSRVGCELPDLVKARLEILADRRVGAPEVLDLFWIDQHDRHRLSREARDDRAFVR
jgi:hypothetical protein